MMNIKRRISIYAKLNNWLSDDWRPEPFTQEERMVENEVSRFIFEYQRNGGLARNVCADGHEFARRHFSSHRLVKNLSGRFIKKLRLAVRRNVVGVPERLRQALQRELTIIKLETPFSALTDSELDKALSANQEAYGGDRIRQLNLESVICAIRIEPACNRDGYCLIRFILAPGRIQLPSRATNRGRRAITTLEVEGVYDGTRAIERYGELTGSAWAEDVWEDDDEVTLQETLTVLMWTKGKNRTGGFGWFRDDLNDFTLTVPCQRRIGSGDNGLVATDDQQRTCGLPLRVGEYLPYGYELRSGYRIPLWNPIEYEMTKKGGATVEREELVD